MELKYKKGQTILTVLMWAAGFSAAVAIPSVGVVIDKFDDIDTINREQDKVISEIGGDVKEINAKLDILLKDRGYNPGLINGNN